MRAEARTKALGWRTRLQSAVVRGWLRRGCTACLLLPLAALYSLLIRIRHSLYQHGWRQSHGIDGVTVLVVGNVVAGGAGKTPTVISIVRHLGQQGLRVGVVSRGYGRQADDIREVAIHDRAEQVGDEPLLIARASGVPVFVGRARAAAARAALLAHPDLQVIVCDDGLQHHALQRDIEVCVFDDRGVGNGWLLPSGPLREPWPRRLLALAGGSAATTLVLHTGEHPAFGGYRAHRALASHALRADGSRLGLDQLAAHPPLLALAGIAQPEVFFNGLRQAGIVLDATLPLPDHFDYAALDLQPWLGHQILCTEKDAIKLWHYAPAALAIPLLQTIEPAFFTQLDALLHPLLNRPLSSAHGHQTA